MSVAPPTPCLPFSHARPIAAATGAALRVLLGGALSVQPAQAAMNPPVLMAHGVEYMSGGIGQDEAQLMETVSPRSARELRIRSIEDGRRADFAVGVHVTVRDSHGTALLDNVGPRADRSWWRGSSQAAMKMEARTGGQTLKQPLPGVVGRASQGGLRMAGGH